MCREPPVPSTGFEAVPRSGVKIAVPTDAGTERSLFNENTSKLGWFKRLKNSPRNCILTRSLNFQIFEIEKSHSRKEGPRKILRPMLPKVRGAGGVSTVFPST